MFVQSFTVQNFSLTKIIIKWIPKTEETWFQEVKKNLAEMNFSKNIISKSIQTGIPELPGREEKERWSSVVS